VGARESSVRDAIGLLWTGTDGTPILKRPMAYLVGSLEGRRKQGAAFELAIA
jgi:hypothetical protein